jgi:glycosyltransferase involved in cell wall biosynthesis
MKILLVVHLFLPDYYSGTEILTLDTAKELQALGHDVHVFTGFPGEAEMLEAQRFDRYEFDGIPVTRFKHSHRPMGDQDNVVEQEYDNRLVAKRFGALLDEFTPEVVHFFHLMRVSASLVDVCARREIPTVLTPTDFWFLCPMGQMKLPNGRMCAGPDDVGANCIKHLATVKMPAWIGGALSLIPDSTFRGATRLALRTPFKESKAGQMMLAMSRRKGFLLAQINRIDRVMLPTGFMRQTLLTHGLEEGRSRFCAYGIRWPVLPESPDNTSAANGPLRLGVIGVGEHKGPQILIAAVRELAGLPIVAKIYGKASDAPENMRKLVALAGGDGRIEFCGSFPNHEIGEVLSGLDVLVVPSLWFENAPLVIYSAQAAGVPVIASDVAGIVDMVTDDDNGYLFPPGDVSRLAAIIRMLSGDRGKLKALGERARMPKTIAMYVKELLDVYTDVGASHAEAS